MTKLFRNNSELVDVCLVLRKDQYEWLKEDNKSMSRFARQLIDYTREELEEERGDER